METRYSISVIVPVYNDAALVFPSTAVIDDFFSTHFRDYEILIIESGSTDATGRLCDEVALQRPRVRVIHEGARNGFGSAVRLGYRESAKDLIMLVTFDLGFPLESVLQAIPHLDRVDYVLSYRSQDTRAWTRRAQSFVYNLVVTRLLGLRVRHINSGFRLFPRTLVQDLPIESKGWFVDAEVLSRLARRGHTFVELPVPLIDRTEGKSSLGPFAFVKVLEELWQFRKKMRLQQKRPRSG